MYQEAQKLGKTSKAIRTFGIEDNQVNIVTDYWWAFRIWVKYIQDVVWFGKLPRCCNIRRKGTKWRWQRIYYTKNWGKCEDDNIPVDLLKELGDNGLK